MPRGRERVGCGVLAGSAAFAVSLLLSGVVAAADARPPRTLTLTEAVALALGNHPARLAEHARVSGARERIGEARAALLPQVTGLAEYLRATDDGVGTTVYWGAPGIPRVPSSSPRGGSLTDTFDNYLGGITAFQSLLDFGRRRGVVAQRTAEADREAARAELVDLDLTFGVSRSYYDLLAAREIVGVDQKAVDQRKEHLHDAEVKAAAGLEPEIDVYASKAELARAELNLADARNVAADAKLRLDDAMGIGAGGPDYELANALERRPVPAALDPLLAAAWSSRPDVRMLDAEARAADAVVREFTSDYFPAVGAAAGVDARGQGTDAARNGYVGLVVQWSLFNGFLTDHELAEAKARTEEVHHAMTELRQDIALQVQTAFLDLQAADKRIVKAEQTLEASRVELALAERRYQSGLGTILELIDAQRRNTEDKAAVVSTLASSSVAEAALARATGSRAAKPD